MTDATQHILAERRQRDPLRPWLMPIMSGWQGAIHYKRKQHYPRAVITVSGLADLQTVLRDKSVICAAQTACLDPVVLIVDDMKRMDWVAGEQSQQPHEVVCLDGQGVDYGHHLVITAPKGTRATMSLTASTVVNASRGGGSLDVGTSASLLSHLSGVIFRHVDFRLVHEFSIGNIAGVSQRLRISPRTQLDIVRSCPRCIFVDCTFSLISHVIAATILPGDNNIPEIIYPPWPVPPVPPEYGFPGSGGGGSWGGSGGGGGSNGGTSGWGEGSDGGPVYPQPIWRFPQEQQAKLSVFRDCPRMMVHGGDIVLQSSLVTEDVPAGQTADVAVNCPGFSAPPLPQPYADPPSRTITLSMQAQSKAVGRRAQYLSARAYVSMLRNSSGGDACMFSGTVSADAVCRAPRRSSALSRAHFLAASAPARRHGNNVDLQAAALADETDTDNTLIV